jgi:hypothetical protein
MSSRVRELRAREALLGLRRVVAAAIGALEGGERRGGVARALREAI